MPQVLVNRQATLSEIKQIHQIMEGKAIVHRYGVKRSTGITYDQILAIADILNQNNANENDKV